MRPCDLVGARPARRGVGPENLRVRNVASNLVRLAAGGQTSGRPTPYDLNFRNRERDFPVASGSFGGVWC